MSPEVPNGKMMRQDWTVRVHYYELADLEPSPTLFARKLGGCWIRYPQRCVRCPEGWVVPRMPKVSLNEWTDRPVVRVVSCGKS